MAEPLRKIEYEAVSEQRISDRRPVSRISAAREPERQAYQILRVGFTAAPILAGLDKFFDILGNWDAYVAPVFPRILGVSPHSFMMGVGVIEIIAGIGVAVKPRIFGYVVSGWLAGIIVNLLIRQNFYDVALRDLGLSLSAFALARLAVRFDRKARLSRVEAA
jgi:hypothetical protein